MNTSTASLVHLPPTIPRSYNPSYNPFYRLSNVSYSSISTNSQHASERELTICAKPPMKVAPLIQQDHIIQSPRTRPNSTPEGTFKREQLMVVTEKAPISGTGSHSLGSATANSQPRRGWSLDTLVRRVFKCKKHQPASTTLPATRSKPAASQRETPVIVLDISREIAAETRPARVTSKPILSILRV